jgi:methyl-accepting chemotaxis protein
MRFTLGKKLGLSFGVILALMTASATISYWKLGDIKQREDHILAVAVPSLDAARMVQKDLNWAANKGRQMVLAGTQADRREQAKTLYDGAWNDIDKDLSELNALAPHWASQENRDRLSSVKEQVPGLRQSMDLAISHAAGGGPNAIVNAGNEFADKTAAALTAIKKTLEELADAEQKLVKRDGDDLAAANLSLHWTLALATLLALAVGAVVAILLSRQISAATASVLQQAEAIASGDLTRDEVKLTSSDELGDLTTAINKMHGKLRGMIVSIDHNAQQVATASEEFSSTSQQITANSEETSAQANVVSAATEQVNRNLQTVATATEEMSASISEIAKNASEAAKVAGEALRAATETNATVIKLGESSA